VRLKMPIQIAIPNTEEKQGKFGLKSYTAYCIKVNDFGRNYVVERRFDDFLKLHQDLTTTDRGMPPLPEKKMFASTDASVVAERRPALERLLRHLLRSEEVAFESDMHLWKFLDLPLPAMVAARFLYKSRRLKYVTQCGKLLNVQYEKEHSYRLCHPSILKTNLHLLTAEGTLVGSGTGDGQSEGSTSSQGRINDQEMETAVIDMIRYAVGQGGEEVRQCFLEENGLATMLNLLLRIAGRDSGATAPDERVRKVLNALIHGEGDRYPETFANFLASGGVSIFAGFKDLCAQHVAFAEFIGKALWLAWEVGTQIAFLQADTSSGEEALALLSAVWGSGSKTGEIIAGLLLSSLLSNDLFAGDRGREEKAAQGLLGLVEELIFYFPTFGQVKSAEAGVLQQGASAEELQAAEAFIATVGRSERAFARVLACVEAPCGGSAGGAAAHAESPVWSSCAFALWCVLRVRPKPERVARLRPLVPVLSQCGPPRVRWLTGEFLLQLHVPAEEPSKGAAAAGGGAAAAAPHAERAPAPAAAPAAAAAAASEQLDAEAACLEQAAVEASMSEQVNHRLAQLQEGLQQNRGVMLQQRQLSEIRQQPLVVGADGGWSAELCAALEKLGGSRERLSTAGAGAAESEAQTAQSLISLASSVQLDVGSSAVAGLEDALRSVQSIEGLWTNKREELTQYEDELKAQDSIVERCAGEMEEAEKTVNEMRRRISEMEQELSGRQREAQQYRTLASSDFVPRRKQLTMEVEQIDKEIGSIKDKFQKIQAGETPEGEASPLSPVAAQEVAGQLRQQAAKCKSKRADLQAELQKLSVDPASAQESALRLEQEASELHEQLSHLRSSELMELEGVHVARREAWQSETTRLQEVRHARDRADRESSDLGGQLDERWRLWRPLWATRVGCWHERATTLSEAQVYGRRFEDAVRGSWDAFRDEEDARHEVLQAIANAQATLSALAQQVAEIGDLGLGR